MVDIGRNINHDFIKGGVDYCWVFFGWVPSWRMISFDVFLLYILHIYLAYIYIYTLYSTSAEHAACPWKRYPHKHSRNEKLSQVFPSPNISELVIAGDLPETGALPSIV